MGSSRHLARSRRDARLMTSPIRVKFLSRVRLPDLNVGSDFLRRFRGRVPEMGRCRFIFDKGCRD